MKSERGFSQSTVQGRMWQAARFLMWYARRRKSLSKILLNDVDRYLAVRAKNWTRVSLQSFAAGLRAFFRYAESRRLCQQGIAEGIKSSPIRHDYFRATGPRWDDVRRLINNATGPKHADLRAKAILILLSVYALRRSEVVRLLLSDFDWANGVFTVHRAKRGRLQQFPIGAELSDALLQYIKFARPQCACQNAFVALRPPYAPMNPTSVSLIVSRRMKRWGICSPKKGPHSLRHACATRLLQEGTSLQEIADFLGHSNTKSIGIYAKFDLEALRQVSVLDPCGDL